MNSPAPLRLVIARDKIHVAGSMWLRQASAGVFIVLMALFFTAPVPAAVSAYERPLPMPEELGSGALPPFL